MTAPAARNVNLHPAHERRAFPRHPSPEVPVTAADVRDQFGPFAASVVNYSEGGLRLLASRPVPAGTVLKVRPGRASAFASLFRVEVVYCLAQDDRWVLGCQFAQAPSARELLVFA